MAISLTKLRSNLYNVIDAVIETGVPVEIERNGRVVKIVADQPKNKLDNLTPHPGTMVGDPEDFVHIDWLKEWTEENHL